jgi:hypothetical protein
MGGAVHEGIGRSPFAPGGAVDPNDLSALLAQRRQMYGLDKAGLYGGSPYDMPHGGKSAVPQTQVHVSKLITAGAAPRAPQSGMGQGMDAYKTVKGFASDIEEIGKGLGKAKDYVAGKINPQSSSSDQTNPAFRSSEDEREKAAGGLVLRHHFAGGGMPYGAEEDNPYDADKENRTASAPPSDILGDVVSAGKQQVQTLPKPGEPPKPPSSGLGDAAKAVGMGKNLAQGAGKLFGESGPLAGLLGSGAEAGAAAAGVGEAAAGLGAAAEGASLLGTLGTGAAAVGEGVMAALPFLAFLSDERTKENKRVVGELFNGE